jgi:hypothetical protein
MANPLYPLMALAGFGSSFLGKSKDDDIPFWDWTRDYYMFPPEYTGVIDELLVSSYGMTTQQIITGDSRRIPGNGYHYFFKEKDTNRTFIGRNFHYIMFEKKNKKIKNEDVTYYRCYVGGVTMGKQQAILKDIIYKIFRTNSRKIRAISIDTSGSDARPMYVTLKYSKPMTFQQNIIDWIIKEYENSADKNIKVIVSAKRGTGKSFMARGVKKTYEKKHSSHFIKLFSDFNPTNIGVNIKSIILPEADSVSPVLIVIDEIDEIFKDVLKSKNLYDTRTHHTKDKSTFVQMMDAIGDTPNVIMIGTTEKTPEELYQNEGYHSFMRPGRIDKFIEMDRDVRKTKFQSHKEIKGYPIDDPDPIVSES